MSAQVRSREGTLGVTAVLDPSGPHVLITTAHTDGTCKLSRLSATEADELGDSLKDVAGRVRPLEQYKEKMDEAARLQLERQGLT